MAKIYLYIESADSTYEIKCKKNGHADLRIEERFQDNIIDDEFVARRLQLLLEMNSELADTIVNGVRFGENFIFEDAEQNLSMAIYHELDSLSIGTIFNDSFRMRKYDGQKVLRLFRDGTFRTYIFNRQKRMKVEALWA